MWDEMECECLGLEADQDEMRAPSCESRGEISAW